MPTNTESNVADQAFAEMFTAKLKEAPAPETAAPPAAAAVEDPTPVTASDSASPATESGAVTDEQDTTIVGDAEDDPATESDDDADDAEQEPTTTPAAPEFVSVLARLGIETKPDDVPVADRDKLTEFAKKVEAGVTKLRQRDTEALVALKAEARFQSEHTADWIVAAIRKDPTLEGKVNALFEEQVASPTATAAHDIVVERAREKARAAEETAAGTAEAQAREAAELDVRLSARLDAARVKSGPALERLIAQQLDLNEKLTGRRHITAEQVDEIADAHIATVEAAREHGRKLEKRRLSERRVQDKLTDRATAGLVVRPGAGSAPTPAPAAKPTNDVEFKAHMVAKLRAASRAAAG